ncbi:uncharacterized protein BYT42DRAFT_220418 [Radiomyces spectabilis]|uniref:uncharacterized protein n=1 Tax=Radiomyces spectabilis TaxID=64574 RepID=UPI00221F9C18|nr:uncharacterized protein BYT42DRAFT_220418 [Radiomyces spectabilis]KAI8388062.1 hypothetical protein BYT42DRAFT_220418 [Radiomyces spectabilis]
MNKNKTLRKGTDQTTWEFDTSKNDFPTTSTNKPKGGPNGNISSNPFRVSLLCRNMYRRSLPQRPSQNDKNMKSVDTSKAAERSTRCSALSTEYSNACAKQKELSTENFDSMLEQLEHLHIKPSNRAAITRDRLLDERRDNLIRSKTSVYNFYSRSRLKESFDDLYAKSAIPEPKVPVQPLTEEENELVDSLLRKGQHGLVSQIKAAVVEFKDIYKLYPETWLNDEIINFYLALISDRASQKADSLPSIHCFNTFFCSTLRESGYAKVRRWTKKVDIFSKDLILIPINHAYHWTLGIIHVQKKLVEVYDSLGGNHDYTIKLLFNYLQQEHMDKKGTPLDLSDWTSNTPKDIPHQKNMSDCGVFTCTFAERLAGNRSFDFSQEDMTLIRRRMVLSIAQKSIP